MLWGEITPCGFSGVLRGARVAKKAARGLRSGGMGNVGAVLMEKENSPRVLQARRYPCLAVASLPPFPLLLTLSNVAYLG